MSIAPASTGSNNSYKTPVVCRLCGAAQQAELPFSGEVFPLVKCAACGVTFLFPQPPETELSSYYGEAYYGRGRKKFLGPVELGIAAWSWVKWKKIQPLLGARGRLLDIGCGRGTLVKLARAAGFEAYGIERPSSPDVALPYVFYKDLPECNFPEEHFQAVILWHVLEHLPDPATTLREIHRILRPGGWLYIAVPNFGGAQSQTSGSRWFHLDLPRHLWHFRKSTLEPLLERQGFPVVRCSTFSLEYDWFGTLQSWMNRLLRDENRLYFLVKGERPVPVAQEVFRLGAAGLLLVPALVSALWDAARRQGGTLGITAQKTPNRP
ncbi:MAG: class I SAM-dependent methyltransferase [Acidobacteria bacterium]|nr:class I SAM-dependent methyltransferase [Acidobacteriota bacterium]